MTDTAPRRGRKADPSQPDGMTARTHSGKTEIERMMEEDAVLDLKVQGKTTRQIATELGVSVGTVVTRMKAALARSVDMKAGELRTVMDEQLDGMLDKLQPFIDAGDTKAINAALGILDRKAKLHGLDAPAQVDVTVETEGDREIRGLLEQMRTASTAAKTHLEAL